MSEKRININELDGYGSPEGYFVYPPCCSTGEPQDYPVGLSSIITSGECYKCGAKLNVEITY